MIFENASDGKKDPEALKPREFFIFGRGNLAPTCLYRSSLRLAEDTMKGTRPRNTDEIRRVSHCFDGTDATRNRGLFMQ